MKVKRFDIKVLNLSEIPVNLRKEAIIALKGNNSSSYHQVHYDDSEEDGPLDNWILENHPDLKDENFFFLHIDI